MSSCLIFLTQEISKLVVIVTVHRENFINEYNWIQAYKPEHIC